MEEKRKSESKEGKIKDAESLYGCKYCFKQLYAIFTGLVIDDRFKKEYWFIRRGFKNNLS